MVNKSVKSEAVGSPCLTVFFDGACPLCQREIAFYRRRREADRIAWIDVGQVAEKDVFNGLSRRDALRRFHVMRPEGTLASGGSAFVELWFLLPTFAPIGRVFRRNPLLFLLKAAYRLFLLSCPALQRILRMDAVT